MIQIYHNPRCGKSRNCLALLEKSNKKIEIINYLVNPPTADELKSLLQKLNISPIELVRQKEEIWITNFKGKIVTPDEIIQAMVEHPILIERPIVTDGIKTVIGRDLEKVIPLIE